jgi:hypothetical protein
MPIGTRIPMAGDKVRLTADFGTTDPKGNEVLISAGAICMVESVAILPAPQGLQFCLQPEAAEPFYLDEEDLIDGLYPFMHESTLLATEAEREAARDRIDDPTETQIDEDALVSHADDGFWVAAWVWVPQPEDESEDA